MRGCMRCILRLNETHRHPLRAQHRRSRIVQAGVDDAGKHVNVPVVTVRDLKSKLNATFINPVQWRVSRAHHHAWWQALMECVGGN